MTEAVIRLWLKVADPTALTARETLQRALGYGRMVRDVGRSEIWSFRWEASVDAHPLLARLARDTNLFANPNKYHMEIKTGPEPLSPRGNVWILGWREGDGKEQEETLRRHRLVEDHLPEVRRAVLWELDLDAPVAAVRTTAEEIAVARERKRGLLINPHVEDAEVFLTSPTAQTVVRRLFPGETGPGSVDSSKTP